MKHISVKLFLLTIDYYTGSVSTL